MTGMKKGFMALVVLGLVVTASGSGCLFAFSGMNGVGTGYDETQRTDNAAVGDHDSIEDYIVRGTGYYLKARKHTHALLRMVEMQSIDGISTDEMKNAVNKAIYNMNRALKIYEQLVRKAKSLPYNKSVIANLKQFDYDGFKIEFRMNPVVFQKVEELLKNGNITGVFQQNVPVCAKIVSLLNQAKAAADKNNIPDLPVLWTLNETFSESSLFNSYVARIFQFQTIKKKEKPSMEVRHGWK